MLNIFWQKNKQADFWLVAEQSISIFTAGNAVESLHVFSLKKEAFFKKGGTVVKRSYF